MRHSTCKVIILAGTAFCSGILSAARIVHSPVEALTQSGEIKFPYTDSRGGIWTASRCAEANAPSTDEVLTGTFTDWNGSLVGVVMSGVDMPRLGVNPGTTDYENGGLVFHPGDIFLHPFSPEQPGADGKSRGVLTFTVPRNGFYTIRARFRTLDSSFLANCSYTTDTSILIDGAVQHQEDLVHNNCFSDGAPFEREHIFLRKGAKIQFVIGPGWYDVAKYRGDWNHANDGTALKLDLIEEDSERFADDAVLATASLNETLFQATTETVKTAGFEDISGLGNWSVYDSGYWNTLGYLDYFDKSLMNKVSATTMGTSGVRFESTRSEDTVPHLQVVGTTSPYGNVYPSNPDEDAAYKGGRYAPYGVYQPHEIELHPGPQGNVYSCVAIRFTVKESGIYAVTAKVRDTSCSGENVTDGATGIYAWLHINGADADGCYLGAEHAAVQDAWTILRTEAVRLAAGTTVDLFIHPANTYYWDGTGVFFDIDRLKDETAEVWDAGVALRENAQKGASQTNPFVSQGATWTIGWQEDQITGSAFVTAPNQTTVEPYLNGFNDNSIEYFKICGNLATAPFTGNNVTDNGEMFYANEYFAHTMPNYGTYPHAILRFTAPKAGVYSVDAIFRDMSRLEGFNWWETGVDCLIRAAGHYVAAGVADIDASSRPEDLGPAILNADRLYLQEGEAIDAMVGCRNAPWADATAVRETIRPVAVKEVVSVDFDTQGSKTFAGRGRVGFQSPRAWTKLLVAATSSAEREFVRNDRGETTKVKVTLTASEGRVLNPVFEDKAGWPALITDGLSAANDTEVYGWKVSGLEPGATYTLYLYGRDQATFTVNGSATAYGITQSCFFNVLSGPGENNIRDHAVVTATADSAGEIVGTFAGTADGAGIFCGLQIEGDAFALGSRGFAILLR